MNAIKDVLIELRPRLRSCNVTILAESDFAEQYDLKVSLRPNVILMNYNDYRYTSSKSSTKRRPMKNIRKDSSSSYESYSESDEEGYSYSKFINVTQYCKIVPNSLSFLKVEDNFISFRILTEPTDSNSGNFHTEMIDNPSNNYIVKTDALENHVYFNKQSPKLKTNDRVKLMCNNCLNYLSLHHENSFISFDRILEMPSDNLDISDWFCHAECGGNQLKFEPKTTDLFYGLCHFIVNNESLQDNFLEFNKNRKIICCNRCFSWLGVKYNGNCIKFWDSSVKFSKSIDGELNVENLRFFSDDSTSGNIPLDNFLYVVRYAIKNSFCSAFSSTCKLIIECEILKDKKNNLLIWVMDKFLDVLIKTEPLSADVNEIKLKHILTSKLLYKFDVESDVLKTWHNDSCVQSFEVSKDMFLSAKKYLTDMNSRIPQSFRKTNDFYVSYLKI